MLSALIKFYFESFCPIALPSMIVGPDCTIVRTLAKSAIFKTIKDLKGSDEESVEVVKSASFPGTANRLSPGNS